MAGLGRRGRLVFAHALLVAAGLFLACGVGEQNVANVNVSNEGGGGAPAPTVPPVPGRGPVDAAGDASDAPRSCTADLGAVVDSQNRVVATCTRDQWCAQGTCMPACAAAGLARGSVGCDFVISTPTVNGRPPCFSVTITNLSRDLMQKIELTRDGQVFDVSALARIRGTTDRLAPEGAPPGEGVVVALSGDPTSGADCDLPKAVAGSTAVYAAGDAGDFSASTGRGKAFRLKTDVPVSVTDAISGPQAHRAVLFPVTAWGTSYRAAEPNIFPSPDPLLYPLETPQGRPNSLQILAMSDATTVKVHTSSDLPGGGGVPSAAHGDTVSLSLNAGEYVQWQGYFDNTGSLIESDKPVGLVAGSPLTGYMPATSRKEHTFDNGNAVCTVQFTALFGTGAAHTPLLPVAALGSLYVGDPATESIVEVRYPMWAYRLVGAVDGTTLTYDPAPDAPGPSKVDAGQSLFFMTSRPVVVKSQDDAHPFQLIELGHGPWRVDEGNNCETCSCDNGYLGGVARGGTYMRILPPAGLWMNRQVGGASDLLLQGYSDVLLQKVGAKGTYEPLAALCRDGRTITMSCATDGLSLFDHGVQSRKCVFPNPNDAAPPIPCDAIGYVSESPFIHYGTVMISPFGANVSQAK